MNPRAQSLPPSGRIPDVIRMSAPAFPCSHSVRAHSGSTARIEAPAWSRMRRGFAAFWQDQLTDHGRDLVRCLAVVPAALITGTVLAMMLAPIWQGIPA